MKLFAATLMGLVLLAAVPTIAQEVVIQQRIERGEQTPPGPPPQRTPGAAAGQPGADLPKATLRGRVFNAETGAPLKRAQLMLRLQRRGEAAVFGPVAPSGAFQDAMTATTDAAGSFEFKNVEPGSYFLQCTRSGFMQAGYGQKSPSQPVVPLTVAPGAEMKDLDFRLIRGGVISGTVVDEDGEPLSNVQVQTQVRQYTRGQSRLMPRGMASTDDRGQYRIFNLPPGRYYVQASMRSFGEQDSRYAPIYYPNVLGLQDAQRVEVTRGAELSRVDFRLHQVPTFTVAGKVLDQATGQPITGGSVSASPFDSMMFQFGSNMIRPDGTFRLRGLTPGRYRLMVMMRSGVGQGPPQRPITKVFDLGQANIENMVVTVGPGVSVRGKITADGGTLSPENVLVFLNPKGDPGMGFMTGTSTVTKDLTFEVFNVQPGDYTVNVSSSSSPFMVATGAGGNAPFYVREVRAGSEDVVDRGLTVPEGAAMPEVEVIVDFKTGTVGGRVLNDSGEPISGAQVALVSADRQKRGSDRYFRSGSADQTGQFSIRGVIPGDYLLLVWPESDVARVQDPDLLAALEKHAVSVTVEKSGIANKDIRLTDDVRLIAQRFSQ